jgi:acetyl/propionyl-CoA carboxylase alpha subunit
MTPIRRLLVANRGEIARRIMRTAREMGIETVAVFSDADAGSQHVADADSAVRLPGVAPSDTYLRIDALLAAASATGADAVHPGYGFLAESAVFAEAVVIAGLTWVGPPPHAIDVMGSKLGSKELMQAAGVPTLPWTTDPAAAADIGFPLLVKASAGGGGRGMRVVGVAADLPDAVDGARREAASAFGDDTVFLERYVDDPRHIEIQIFADDHGHCVSLFERECSIQRRHQKLVEECPSPFVDADLRERMGAAATAAAVAVGYRGAGTVEFVVTADGEFAFLEMNTRLQVEHPVTEAVTGLDLVRLQLLVAAGEPLPPEALQPQLVGHAIEVRLVAEDVGADFLPQSGRLRDVEFAAGVAVGAARRNQVTVDSGFEAGDHVPPHYDSLLAKVIGHAPTRAEAATALAAALQRSTIFGVPTDRDLLVAILREPEFLAGMTDTGYLARHHPAALVAGGDRGDTARRVAVAAASVARQHRHRLTTHVWPRLSSGWRNNPSEHQHVRLVPQGDSTALANDPADVRYLIRRGGWEMTVDGQSLDLRVHSLIGAPEHLTVDATVDGIRRSATVTVTSAPGGGVSTGGEVLDVTTALGCSTWQVEPRFVDPAAAVALGSLVAPMPGSVVRVLAEVGDQVEAGTPLIVLEAMKMEHTVQSPGAGVVTAVEVSPGQQVDGGAVLVVVDEAG